MRLINIIGMCAVREAQYIIARGENMDNVNTMNLTEVVTYGRASTMEQVKKGEGLDIQADRNKAFCAAKNYFIAKEFVDEGVSGDLDVHERPDLLKLIEYCKERAGIVKYAVIDRVDRFARDLYQHLYVEHALMPYGVRILFALQDSLNDTSDGSNAAMITAMRQVMGAFSQYDLFMIRKRLLDGMCKKAEKGNRPVGRQPFGYCYDEESKYTVINEAEAAIVRKIFNYRTMGLTFEQMATFLNTTITDTQRKQFGKANRNRKWSAQSVKVILQNDFYIGVVTYQNKKIAGNHPKLIDMELWMQVNGVDKRKKPVA